MSQILRSPGLTRVLLLAAAGLVPVGLPLFTCSPCLANPFTSQDYGGQDPVPDPGAVGQLPGDDEAMPRRTSKSKSARKKSRQAEKDTTKKADSTGKTKSAATRTKKGDSGQLRFSQDIAPIFVANCVRCHSGDGVGVKKGKLDLSTFEKLLKGTPDNPKVVSPGNAAESSLVLRIKGEETPRMPQGANQVLAGEAIAKIEQWVKQGARLDKGLDPKKPIESYAASGEQVRRAQVARLPQA
ncbi:MAG TPA: c-type cytochrome domain-containing protein, partial [Isosphaeraceae bacterium]|nr:c-type cytochrome domain-containing protein [Isosphaeraceae bacterium]